MGNCESTSGVIEDGDNKHGGLRAMGFPMIPRIPTSFLNNKNDTNNNNTRKGPGMDPGPTLEKSKSDIENEEFNKWLREFQESNFHRMKHELRTDTKTFVLNLLLMCIQFFDNFDRSLILAKDFKVAKEAQMNENLGSGVNEGGITGERRVFLLHGIAEILAKNYVYKPSNQSQASDDIYEKLSLIHRKFAENSSFMCEGILPLDFFLSFENVEAYPENEWRKLKDNDYSSAPGDPPTFRCCIEEPDPPANKIPRGYVSLYCEEENSGLLSMASGSESNKLTDDYSRESELYFDKSLSYYGSTNPSDEEDGDSVIGMTAGQKFLHGLAKNIDKDSHSSSQPSHHQTQNQSIVSKEPPKTPTSILRNHQTDGVIPRNYPGPSTPKSIMKLAPISDNIVVPKIVVQDQDQKSNNPSTPIPKDFNGKPPSLLERRTKNREPNAFFPDNQPLQNGSLLGPPRGKNLKPRRERDREKFGEESANVPPPPPAPPLMTLPSNGNASVNNNDRLNVGSVASRSSSVVSEEVRTRYRNLELKELWQYNQRATPRLTDGARGLPIPPECLTEIKKPKDEDDDEEEERAKAEEDSEDTSSSDDTDSDKDNDSNSVTSSSIRRLKHRQKKLGRRRASSTDENSYRTLRYVNSAQFSGIFCGDFNSLALKLGINSASELQHAQVLGTTVRCPIQYALPSRIFNRGGGEDDDLDVDDEKFRVLYTFTPCVRSKYFPQKSLIAFRQRLLEKRREREKNQPEGAIWPKRLQVDNIESFGCYLIPLGFRSIQFFNTQQSLEWLTSFGQGENLLLNTFKNVHWRSYIFSAILFRAFISHMGPRGLGLEHIRQILYSMCEENFIAWNDEEPGTQLKVLLARLYDCLGRRFLPNFFNHRHNMLKNIPVENTQLVQAFLSKIRENLIIHCIYAFRNLTCLQPKHKFYPPADFKKLYRLVTAPREMDLLYITNPYLKAMKADTGKSLKKGKKSGQKNQINILERSEEIEREHEISMRRHLNLRQNQPDKQQRNFRKKYGHYMRKQERKKSLEKKHEDALKESIPPTEKRKSIDLERPTVPKFSTLRMVMIIEFFIEHFLEMAKKAIEFNAFSEATMYSICVENLCRLLRGMRLSTTPMDESQIDQYLVTASDLLKKIGPRTSDYIKSKLSHFDLPNGMSDFFTPPSQYRTTPTPNSGQSPSRSPSRSGKGQGKSGKKGRASPSDDNNNNNFSLVSRKLPTPPPSAMTSMRSGGFYDMKFMSSGMIPRVGMSMLALPTNPSMFSPIYSDDPEALHDEFELTTLDRVQQRNRRRNLKYIQGDSPSRHYPSFNPSPNHLHHPHRHRGQRPSEFNPNVHMSSRPDSISPRPASSNSYFSATNSLDSIPSTWNNSHNWD